MADVITRFKLETTQYDSKLRDASKGISEYARMAQNAGNEFQKFTQKNVEAARALGDIAVAAKNPKDKVKELVGAFNDAAKAYNNLTKEQQQSDWGQALAGSVQKLKMRLGEAKKELYDIGDTSKTKFGELGNVINTLGSKLGITGNLTEMLTSKTALLTGAIGAGTTAVVAATKAWVDYNSELSKQDQVTTVVTGLKGSDANRMTDAARSISKVYGVDFRQVIESANTLMTQFGKSGDEALQLLRDGMQGMIQGDGPKLLSMIQQYAPAFQSAGVSAAQLVAVIQNSEGGLFTDQNMQAIIMGLGRIRNMTKNTAEALKALGIDADGMKENLRNGSMTIFEALQQVGKAIDENKGKSEEVGAVMQDVFGRQARVAGDNLGKAIAELNTNLEETKKQTGEVGEAFAELETANERLNVAIRECFGYDGWQQMSTGIKTELVTTLTDVLTLVKEIKETWIGQIGETIFSAVNKEIERTVLLVRTLLKLETSMANAIFGGGDKPKYGTGKLPGNVRGIGPNKILQGYQSTYGSEIPTATTTTENPPVIPTTTTPTSTKLITGGIKGVKEFDVGVQQYESMAELQKQLSYFQKQLVSSTNVFDEQAARQGIERTQWAMSDVGRSAAKIGWNKDDMEKVSEEMADAILPSVLDNIINDLKDGKPEGKKRGDKTSGTGKFDNKETATLKDVAGDLGQMNSGMNSIVSGLQQLGIELPEGLQEIFGGIQAVTSILSGIATVVATIQTIAAINTFKLFSGGGVVHAANGFVPGNHYSGDMIPALLNSGELVLNMAQQNNLATLLTNKENQGGGGQQFVSGQYIFLGTNNYLKGSGQGQLVTTQMLKQRGIW